MKYDKVYINSMGYELPPVVVTSREIEEMLGPMYEKLHIPFGQLEALTGIGERRWWERGLPLAKGAVSAAKKALAKSSVKPQDVDILIYGGVCRDGFEPATACAVASELGISPDSIIYDISNACLGVLNGIVDIANRIQLGQSRAGLVVSTESARDIVEITIRRMLDNPTMANFISSIATLTGGSGSTAILVTDGSFGENPGRKLMGGVTCADPIHHRLCTWGMKPEADGSFQEVMKTDSVSVLKYGVELGVRTWNKFLDAMGWKARDIDRTICHQVGSSHRDTILKSLGIPSEKDFFTFPFLGNIGTVSLPITAAIAEERGFIQKGQKVGFLGIGSGLNCLMLGWEW